MPGEEINHDPLGEPYNAGLRVGFGIAALTFGAVSFLSLLGAEKAVTAIVFGVLAMRGVRQGSLAKRLGRASVVLGAAFLFTMAALLVVFHDQVMELVRVLQKLS